MNMKKWCEDYLHSEKKKALPILSFPCVQLLGITVKDLISDSEKQAEGIRLVAERCDSAAAIAMMDLSVEAEAFGAVIHASDDEVPTVIGSLIEEPEDADKLEVPSVGAGRTGLYIDAIGKCCKTITDRPVLAGTIGPFSLSGRLMGMSEIMMNCYDEPEMVETTMEKASDFLIEYIKGYKAVGANGVCIAEPAAGLLSPSLVEEIVLPYTKKIIEAVQDENFCVILHNCGNTVNRCLDFWAENGAMGYHFGNAVNMEEICEKMPKDVLVFGNVDAAGQFRNGTVESITQNTMEVMEKCCKYPNFVISSGCDVPPMTPWENIDAFYKAVSDFYSK